MELYLEVFIFTQGIDHANTNVLVPLFFLIKFD